MVPFLQPLASPERSAVNLKRIGRDFPFLQKSQIISGNVAMDKRWQGTIWGRKRIERPHQVFTCVSPDLTRVCFWSYHFCRRGECFLFEQTGEFTKESGGRVAQLPSGSVEADSPHLHQTAALFWHASKSWPWWSLMSGGMMKNRGCITLCCALGPL